MLSTSAQLPDSEPVVPSGLRPIVACGLSCLVHLLILVAGVVLFRSPPRPAIEVGRSVGIVLTAAPAQDEVQYFDQEGAIGQTGSDGAPSDKPDASATSAAEASGLPAADQPPATSIEVDLPGEKAVPGQAIDVGAASIAGASSGPRILNPTAGMQGILDQEARRPRPAGPVGPQAEVSLFGSGTTQGHSFVFVIDRSQSMGSEGLGAIAAAEAELLAALEQLKSNHQFTVVAYNQSPHYLLGRKLLPVTRENLDQCRYYLKNLAAFGATDHERAIISALQLAPDVLYLLTDGDPALNAGQRKRIREEARGHTKITCIQFGRGRPDDESTRTALQTVANENGGTYIFVDMGRRK